MMDKWIAMLVGGVLLGLMGFAISRGKSGSLLIGHDILTEDEKARWNLPAMQRFLSRTLYLEAGWCLLGGIVFASGILPMTPPLLLAFVMVLLVSICVSLIYLSNSRRFRL